VVAFFDEYPLNFARPELQSLRELLAKTIYRPRDVEDVITRTDLNPGYIDFSGSPVVQWYSILTRARDEQKVAELLTVVRQMHPPLGSRLDELTAVVPVLQPKQDTPASLRDPEGPGWKGFGAERQIVEGVDTLLGISFLDLGLHRSRSICRLTATFDREAAHGTGALIGDDLLLTNHHVLYDVDHGGTPANAVEAWFDYELDIAGATKPLTVVPCDASTIVGNAEHDWAVIRTAAAPPPTATVLNLTVGDVPQVDDYVFIIQHPEGGPKMIGLSHNIVRYVDDNVLQYWTDTKAGSSGSPVFDSSWRVVGLHHLWVEAPPTDGVAYRNQGRRIERVLAGLKHQGIPVGSGR
jgi:V8-like Glu-specific endopeptidase